MNTLVDRFMVFLMSYLVHCFGFTVAVKIKDSLDFFAGGIFFGVGVLWIVVNAFIHMERDKGLDENVAIMRTTKNEITVLRINPRTIGEGVEILIGYYIRRFFPDKKIYYKRLRHIATILYIIAFLVLVIGLVMASWVTPESFEQLYHH